MGEQPELQAIIERIIEADRQARNGDLAAEGQFGEDLKRLRKLPPTDRIRGYQALRERGVLDPAMAACLVFPIVEEIAAERATAALDRFPEVMAEDQGDAIYDAHIAEVLREHGEEQIAEMWEDLEQRRQLLDAWGWRPPDPN